MKLIRKILPLAALIVVSVLSVSADNSWFAIFYKNGDWQKVKAIKTENLDSLTYFGAEENGFPSSLRLNYNAGEEFSLSLDSVESIEVRSNIPTLYITTDSIVEEVPDKENYLMATFRYLPYSQEEDSLVARVNIRGRGNSTWFMPKKPYRLKFDKKQEFAGLTKAKSFVLIANYLDNSLLKNAAAFKLAELVGMNYYNTAVPVDLVFNGEPRGSYMLTQKIGINAGSTDFDENSGILWEIDTYFDEPYRFRSSRFDLPCMVKDPDFLEIAEADSVTASALWAYWKADLDLALAKVYDGKWQDVIDARQFAKYILVNHLVGNFEITQAKSVYLYKTSPGEKYCFGPVWDFDWALGFTDHAYPVGCQFALRDTEGYEFLMKILPDPQFQKIFAEELDDFCTNGLDSLMQYIDDYASMIRISARMDSEIWPEDHFYEFERHDISTKHFDENVEAVKNYILTRISNIRKNSRYLLY